MMRWIRQHGLALAVSTTMFAIMAMLMAEFLMYENSDNFSLFMYRFDRAYAASLGADAALWTWRLGGLCTWPVFMWLMLAPYARNAATKASSVMTKALVVAAAYGGLGLWLISSILDFLLSVDESALLIASPILTLLMLFLPFTYVWGFVAIYGFSRDALAGREVHTWIGSSIGSTILGVYGIGFLIYSTIAAVLLPLAFINGYASGDVAAHMSVDLLAASISTGNFVSQWFAFKKVDEKIDESLAGTNQERPSVPPQVMLVQPVSPQPVVQQSSAQPSTPQQRPVASAIPVQPAAQPLAAQQQPATQPPVAPAQPTAQQPAATQAQYAQILPDGRVLMPDGRIIVLPAQDQASAPAPSAAQNSQPRQTQPGQNGAYPQSGVQAESHEPPRPW